MTWLFKDPAIRLPRVRAITVPGYLQPYKYRVRRNAGQIEPVVSVAAQSEEALSGFVNDLRASALEERFAIALRLLGFQFIFQYQISTPFQLPGEGNKVDFIVFDAGIGYPLEIGASFVHKSPAKQEEDRVRDAIVNDVLIAQGFQPVQRLPLDRPVSVEDALELIRDLFVGA